jgi:hypothetical protein
VFLRTSLLPVTGHASNFSNQCTLIATYNMRIYAWSDDYAWQYILRVLWKITRGIQNCYLRRATGVHLVDKYFADVAVSMLLFALFVCVRFADVGVIVF